MKPSLAHKSRALQSGAVAFSIPILAVLCSVALLQGCSTATEKAQRAIDKSAKADAAVRDNRDEQVRKAATFVNGVGTALQRETNRTPAITIAYDLNERAAGILGPPPYNEGLAIRQAVELALSPIAAQQAKSAQLLASLDSKVNSLQASGQSLAKSKTDADAAKDQLLVDQSEDAQRYHVWKWRIIKIAAVLFGMVALPFACKILGVLFPAFSPLTSVASSIFSAPGKMLVRAIPEVAHNAGLVAKEKYQQVEQAGLEMAGAINAYKAAHPEDWDKARKFFVSARNPATSDVLTDLRKRAPVIKA